MKKMIIVSPETHTSLFLIKGNIQSKQGKYITLDEIMKILINDYKISHPNINYKLEEKE